MIPRLIFLLAAAVVPTVALVGCGCDDDEFGHDEVVVPPPNADAGDAATLGTEEEWLALTCVEACRRAASLGLLTRYKTENGCQAPTRNAKGQLVLRCDWVVHKSCDSRFGG